MSSTLKSRRLLVSLAAVAAIATGVAACGGDDDTEATANSGGGGFSGQLAGAGASSQEAAQEAWIAGFQDANPDVTVAYDPVGSGGGREQFIAGGVSFAGTDSALSDDEGERSAAIERCAPGTVLQVPVYISPIAVIYNLEGVENLQLDADTIAGIFAQEITTWNDPAIAATNPGVDLPAERITPVNRSDESGTTENFADYLAKAAPDVWKFEVDGYWPIGGGESAQGTSGVVEAVGAGNGTIGYADASQAGDLGVVSVKVGDGFVPPDPAAAATILENSEEVDEDDNIFSFDLDRDTDAEGVYPISLVSYAIACTQYESATEAELVKAYLGYIISPEGQQAAAANAGSAPLSQGLHDQIAPIVESIGS